VTGIRIMNRGLHNTSSVYAVGTEGLKRKPKRPRTSWLDLGRTGIRRSRMVSTCGGSMHPSGCAMN